MEDKGVGCRKNSLSSDKEGKFDIIIITLLHEIFEILFAEGFIKGEALIVLKANSSKKMFAEKIKTFRSHFSERGYSENIFLTTLSEVKFEERKLALQPNQRENK